jgi:DNA-binding GntR family transcriptional regulator
LLSVSRNIGKGVYIQSKHEVGFCKPCNNQTGFQQATKAQKKTPAEATQLPHLQG